MSYDINKLISNVSIRGRAGFALSVAEHLLQDLKDDVEGYELALKAINKCWIWIESQNISGNDLFSLLMDENDDGLILHEGMAEETEKNSWITLTTAIIYLAWLAYETGNIKERPGPVHEVDDDAIQTLMAYAEKSKSYNTTYISGLYSYVEANYSGDPKELGKKITRNQFKNS